jgi:hypothetical protein
MRKGLIAKVVVGIFCCANLVYAAADPFSDVPAKHWAYDAVNKLAKAGIVTGDGDGAFRGDRTMTRYEMAQIVANAMTKSDKADAENKALISKLTNEFADELKSFGKRLDSLEKKQSSIKFDGWFKYRYEHTNYTPSNPANGYTGSKVKTRNEIWLNIQNQFDGKTYFEGSIQNESADGTRYDAATNSWTNGDAEMQVKKAFIGYKAGQTEIAAGRFFPTIGKATLLSTPMMDGARVTFGNEVKTTLYAINFYGADINYQAADVQFNLSKATNMSLAYLGSDNKKIVPGMTIYKSAAIGIESKATPEITISSEYSVNKSDFAKFKSGLSNPYAYFIKAQYKGANPFITGSTGFSVQYRKAVPGFDIMANAAPPAWNSAYAWTNPSGGGSADDLKGFEYGIETTLAHRLMFSAAYCDFKTFDNISKKLTTAQFFYIF